ncbi:precorrin-6Y C5,15-methyltransferase (decarboxylating) subunit CbiT [Clostridium sp.]|uniref:precorrin-6Y C5,15-methyltransferase (decarboxylating) subunit CbiT n=1 Tax=Clostridium sp. TaxID=1506 RepID=UPI0026DBEFC7|nr:precorrin-6Y C5,15-methyltransferase (decarboxylating) subunit CbiT [Clostridium sp.]MDO5038440.1 precorrin-6Y C5,15-methyltransferase (decarboxylating) subunit CbiT [Clostridium sp.]
MKFIKDEEFIRGNCPMTKEDIRINSICKLDIKEDSNVLDIGSGTGSITVQCSMLCPKGTVYSIEKDEDAIDVSKKNFNKFNCNNIKFLEGDAVEHLNKLLNENIKFDSIFVGGSGGSLEEILKLSNKLIKSSGKLVMNFITLKNVYDAIKVIENLNYKVYVTMLQVSKSKGKSLMLIANNPIFIVECRKEDING